MTSMKVKCVLCGAIKTLSSIPTEQPMCDNDLNPMIPVEVSKRWERQINTPYADLSQLKHNPMPDETKGGEK